MLRQRPDFRSASMSMVSAQPDDLGKMRAVESEQGRWGNGDVRLILRLPPRLSERRFFQIRRANPELHLEQTMPIPLLPARRC